MRHRGHGPDKPRTSQRVSLIYSRINAFGVT
jgi:hypothetical protein